MARFLVDESLPGSLADALRQAGHEAVHAHELGLRGRPDEEIYRRAVNMGAILISRDLDFGDVRRFSGAGTVVIRMRRQIQMGALVRRVLALLVEFAEEIEKLEGKLLILEPGRSRIRRIRPQ